MSLKNKQTTKEKKTAGVNVFFSGALGEDYQHPSMVLRCTEVWKKKDWKHFFFFLYNQVGNPASCWA